MHVFFFRKKPIIFRAICKSLMLSIKKLLKDSLYVLTYKYYGNEFEKRGSAILFEVLGFSGL